ncbi:MAG: hypothetical protein U0736_19010 [Gemmataceae bacterium]
MRWIWIDRFIEFNSGKSAKAVKQLSLAEDHFAQHFPGYPVMPAAAPSSRGWHGPAGSHGRGGTGVQGEGGAGQGRRARPSSTARCWLASG